MIDLDITKKSIEYIINYLGLKFEIKCPGGFTPADSIDLGMYNPDSDFDNVSCWFGFDEDPIPRGLHNLYQFVIYTAKS